VEHSSTSPRSQAREDGAPDAPLTVEVGALSEGRGFYVADDGEGIPEADRDRVFEAGVSTVEGGTGFGLSIVDTIADAHGWRVSITESTVGNPIPATGGSSGGADRGGDASDEDSETRGGARFEFRNVVCPE
jgi:signal transduction histidine kinase